MCRSVNVTGSTVAERAVQDVKATSGGLHQADGGHAGVLTGLPGLETVRKQRAQNTAGINRLCWSSRR